MIVRLWTTGLVPEKAAEYDAFANSHSLAMFRALEGCLGVVFVRSGVRGYVFSLWKDEASVEAMEESELYRGTVRDITAAGFLAEPQTAELVSLAGGFLSGEALAEIASLAD